MDKLKKFIAHTNWEMMKQFNTNRYPIKCVMKITYFR